MYLIPEAPQKFPSLFSAVRDRLLPTLQVHLRNAKENGRTYVVDSHHDPIQVNRGFGLSFLCQSFFFGLACLVFCPWVSRVSLLSFKRIKPRASKLAPFGRLHHVASINTDPSLILLTHRHRQLIRQYNSVTMQYLTFLPHREKRPAQCG